MGGVFTDQFRPELVGWTMEITRKILDDTEVGARGRFGKVTTLGLFQQTCVVGSQGPPCDPKIPLSNLKCSTCRTRSVCRKAWFKWFSSIGAVRTALRRLMKRSRV